MSTPPSWPPPPPSSPPPSSPPPPRPLPRPLPTGSAGAPPPYGQVPAPKKSISPILIVVIVIAAVFGGIMVIGIIAAIAIPGLLRARMSGNEAAAIATMRTMSSAQVAWLGSHNGRPALPSCLGDPASCGDTQSTRFLDAEIASLGTRSGYDFGFVLRPGEEEQASDSTASAPTGDAAGAASDPTDAEVRAELEKFSTPDPGAAPTTPAMPGSPGPSPAPVRPRRRGQPIDRGGYAYWASPANPGVSGSRRFCVDETGVIREYLLDAPWTPPSDAEPGCPDTGRALQ